MMESKGIEESTQTSIQICPMHHEIEIRSIEEGICRCEGHMQVIFSMNTSWWTVMFTIR